MTDIAEIFERPDITQILEDENMTELYEICPTQRRYDLTDFLVEQADVDPLQYFTTAVPGFFYSKGNKIKEFIIPEGITDIKRRAFAKSSAEKIALPSTLEMIEVSCFRESALREITIPKNVDYIESNIFAGCSQLHTVHFECTNMSTYGVGLFRHCSSIKNVTFKSLKVLEECMFEDSAIEHISLPRDCTAIRSDAFMHSALKTIEIPASVKTISLSAFIECPYLHTITYGGTYEEFQKLLGPHSWNTTLNGDVLISTLDRDIFVKDLELI